MSSLFPNDLFPLADALQMELFIGGKNEVTGKVLRPVAIPELGMKINMQLKVLSSRVTTSEREPVRITLLIHVAGQLYMLAQTDLLDNEVSVMLMDGAKLPPRKELDGFFGRDRRQLKTLLPMFESASVGRFSREHYETVWKPAKAA